MTRSSPCAAPAASPRRWRGRALCAIAAGHTLVGFLEFPDVWQTLLAAGLWNSLQRDPLRSLVAWFFLFGVLLCLFGMAIDRLDASVPGWPSRALGAGLLGLIAAGVLLMPVSGFWLALPVALSLYRQLPGRPL